VSRVMADHQRKAEQDIPQVMVVALVLAPVYHLIITQMLLGVRVEMVVALQHKTPLMVAMVDTLS